VRYLVTAYYWVVFLTTSTVGFCLASVLFLFTAPFDPARRAFTRFVMTWSHCYVRIWPLWRVRVLHRERIPAGPCVIVVNHQSAADALAVMGLQLTYKFVAKASLFKLPIVGWLMRMMQFIPLERGRPHSTSDMFDGCRKWLRAGLPVLIFPEGTYSGGKRLLPFKRGAFLLAMEEKVPLVPVVLTGTPELIDGDGPLMSTRANIAVDVQAPLWPESFPATDEALATQVRAQFAQALGQSV